MLRLLGRALLIACAVSVTGAAAASAQGSDTVWVWDPGCARPTHLILRVTLDRVPVFRRGIPICRAGRGHETGRARFTLTPARPLVWYGYRSEADDSTTGPGDTTAVGIPIEVEFWQAGGEPDRLLIGYTVSAGNGLHMNSIHFASPDSATTSEMAPGLVVETVPERGP